MSHEKSPSQVESSGNHISSAEANKHRERLQEQIESKSEKSPDGRERANDARHEVEAQALLASEVIPTNNESNQQHTPSPRTRIEKNKSFKTTMNHVRKDLSTSERTMSRIIHQPAVEKVSDVASKTIARPSGLIGAGLAAIIGLVVIFGIAKHAGFTLSGSEMPILLLIGLIIGLLSEWVFKSIKSLLTK